MYKHPAVTLSLSRDQLNGFYMALFHVKCAHDLLDGEVSKEDVMSLKIKMDQAYRRLQEFNEVLPQELRM